LNRGDQSQLMEFLKDYYLGDGCKHFLAVMLDCPDKTSRFYIGRLTSILLNKIFLIYQDSLDKHQVPC
jgi:hypothetical protein